MSLKYVEDWLECMYGKLDTAGQLIPNNQYAWPKPDGPIKLATYDKRFIDSTVDALARNRGLTDRQVVLAIKIITKYKRQWSALGLDPSYLETDDLPLRLPMRDVDRTSSITMESNRLRLRFPYHQKLIAEMHDHKANQTTGSWDYERDSKSWVVDLTEGNLRKLISINEFNDWPWDMDAATQELLDTAKRCFHEPTAIPTMDLAYGEVMFRDVPEQAMESFHENKHGDVIMDALIALRHGISLGPGIKGLHGADHPINSLLAKDTWDLTQNMFLRTSAVREVMRMLPDAEFTFITNQSRNRNIKLKLVDVFMDMLNEKTFLDTGKDLASMDPNLYDTKKNILVVSMGTSSPGELVFIEDQFLGVLHMNVDDDDGPWQPAS